MGQEAIERNFITEMEKRECRQLVVLTTDDMTVERLLAPKDMKVEEGKDYPVTVTLQSVSPPKEYDVTNGTYRSNVRVDDGYTLRPDGDPCEIVHCKYLVGCDGAHSWVRKRLGLEDKSDRSSSLWGALDAVVDGELTTLGGMNIFPGDAGSIMCLTRERNLHRLYVPLGTSDTGTSKDSITLDKIVNIAKDWLKPLRWDLPYVDWWTCYEVAHRCTSTMEAYGGHVLIAGDACHTHSPKAGQGMNVSMMDGFNLAWKLAGVLHGTHNPELIRTYNAERHEVAKQLVAFDRQWSSNFRGSERATATGLQKAFSASFEFMSGTGVRYAPSLIVAGECSPHSAEGVTIGARLQTSTVEQAFSGISSQLQTRIVPNGRWKIIRALMFVVES